MTTFILVSERRASGRFDVHRSLDYRVALSKKECITGTGRTINMASGGVLFSTEHHLPTGRHVEVAIDWPAKLDGNCRMQLVAIGPVLRSGPSFAAIQILRYQFKTRSSLTS